MGGTIYSILLSSCLTMELASASLVTSTTPNGAWLRRSTPWTTARHISTTNTTGSRGKRTCSGRASTFYMTPKAAASTLTVTADTSNGGSAIPLQNASLG